MIDNPEYTANDGLEWVRRSFLRDLVARTAQAEAWAALMLRALDCCQDRVAELTGAAIAVIEGDASGLDELAELLEGEKE